MISVAESRVSKSNVNLTLKYSKFNPQTGRGFEAVRIPFIYTDEDQRVVEIASNLFKTEVVGMRMDEAIAFAFQSIMRIIVLEIVNLLESKKKNPHYSALSSLLFGARDTAGLRVLLTRLTDPNLPATNKNYALRDFLYNVISTVTFNILDSLDNREHPLATFCAIRGSYHPNILLLKSEAPSPFVDICGSEMYDYLKERLRNNELFVVISLSSVQTNYGIPDTELETSLIPYFSLIRDKVTRKYQEFSTSFTNVDYMIYSMYTDPENHKIETDTNPVLRTLGQHAELTEISGPVVQSLIDMLIRQEYGNHKFAMFGTIPFHTLPTYYRKATYFDDYHTVWVVTRESQKRISIVVYTANSLAYNEDVVRSKLSSLFEGGRIPTNITCEIEETPELVHHVGSLILALSQLNPDTAFFQSDFLLFQPYLKIFFFISLYVGSLDVSRFTNRLPTKKNWIGWSFLSLKRYSQTEPISSIIFQELGPSSKKSVEKLAVEFWRE